MIYIIFLFSFLSVSVKIDAGVSIGIVHQGCGKKVRNMRNYLDARDSCILFEQADVRPFKNSVLFFL